MSPPLPLDSLPRSHSSLFFVCSAKCGPHSQVILKRSLKNLSPSEEETVLIEHLSFPHPFSLSWFLAHPGTGLPECLWRDKPCQILYSKVLGFIRKSCNILTTVHQTVWHATTWPTESLWTHNLTLVFILKNSLIFIRHPTLHPGQWWHFLTPTSLLEKSYFFSLITWVNEWVYTLTRAWFLNNVYYVPYGGKLKRPAAVS